VTEGEGQRSLESLNDERLFKVFFFFERKFEKRIFGVLKGISEKGRR
jgi:hypothetical protein